VSVAICHVSCVEVMEVVRGLMVSAVGRESAVIAVAGIVGVIYVAVEAIVTVEPGAGSDKDAAVEPLGTVITVRSAVVRSVVIVAIGAAWCYADADGNLSLCGWNR